MYYTQSCPKGGKIAVLTQTILANDVSSTVCCFGQSEPIYSHKTTLQLIKRLPVKMSNS